MAPSLYETKKALLMPRTLYMRHVKERRMTEPARSMFDLHYYRKPVYDFTAATMAKPDILYDLDIDRDSVVLDVGAYTGDWAQKVVDRYDPEIHTFEPAAAGVRKTRARFAGMDRIHVNDFGLAGRDQSARLALAGPGSSIYTEETPFGLVDVEIRDVVGVLDELGLQEVDLLKVNIEGGEYDLLDRLLGAGWLPDIRLLLVQFHEWHPRAYLRRARIRRALRRTHDEVWNYGWVWEYWARRDA